jgi:hypothetical protein
MSERVYIESMRQRLGLAKDDAKRDAEIEAMTPEKRLELLCGWHLGDHGWAWTFLKWAKDAGYKITPVSRS